MLESAIEKKLKTRLERLGCIVIKFVSPGMRGVPDRLVLIPGGKQIFVECKRPGEKLRKQQSYRFKQFAEVGALCMAVDSVEDIDYVEERVMEWMSQ